MTTPMQFRNKLRQIFPDLEDYHIVLQAHPKGTPRRYVLTFGNEGISGVELYAMLKIATVLRVWATEDTYGTTQFTIEERNK
jgi:hypothetical protein